MVDHLSASDALPVSRRTLLKAFGLAAGASAIPGLLPIAEAKTPDKPRGRPPARAYVYVDCAARSQWVAGAVLVGDPRLLRQLLRRAKRARLGKRERQIPEVEARHASADLRRYFYSLLAKEKGFRRGLGLGVEAYGVHINAARLAGKGDQQGLALLHIVMMLLDACHLSRFDEIFVYHNLPACKGLSRKGFRQALLKGVRRHPRARFRVYAQRALRRAGPVTLANDAVQAADLVTHAFFQKHEYGNAEWLNLIRRVVKRDIDAGLAPGLRSILRV
jgi:hypothetical protein